MLEEKPSGEVYVAEVPSAPLPCPRDAPPLPGLRPTPPFPAQVVPGGNADKSRVIQAGDLLRRCSATTLKGDKSGSDVGHGEYLYNNWSRSMIDCRGLAFDTVMAAIASNNERWGIFDVDLELERPGSSA